MSFIRLCEGLQGFMSLLLRMSTFEVGSLSSADTWGMTTDTAPLPTCNGRVPLRRNIGSWHHRASMDGHFSQHSLPTLTDPPLSPVTLPIPGKLIYMWWPSLWRSCWAHVSMVMGFSNASEIFSILSSPQDPCMSSEAGSRTPGLEGERGYQKVPVWGEDHHVLLRAPGLSPMFVTTFRTSRHCLNVSKHTCLPRISPPTSARSIVPKLSFLPQTQGKQAGISYSPFWASFGFLEISPT